jgi:regulatory protein
VTDNQQQKKIWQVAQGLLVQREHGYKELRSKLINKGYDIEDIDLVMQSLVDNGLQSDWRYGESCIKSRMNKGYGPNFIRQYLIAKGLETDLIEDLLSADDLDWLSCLLRLWQKKYGVVPDDLKQKHKQQKFFYYRGFDSETIQALYSHSI